MDVIIIMNNIAARKGDRDHANLWRCPLYCYVLAVSIGLQYRYLTDKYTDGKNFDNYHVYNLHRNLRIPMHKN